MFRHPYELEAHLRYQSERLAGERVRCSPMDSSDVQLTRVMTQLRKRVGVGLIRVGAIVAGGDALRGLPPSLFGNISSAVSPPGR